MPVKISDLDLATEGVLRYVWSSQWGDMLIEAREGVVYVNGQRVDAARRERRKFKVERNGKPKVQT